MNTIQQGDVLLFDTPDGGEMNIENGVTEMTQGPETMLYLCLVGGNKEDNGTADTDAESWMGNEDEEPQSQYRSRFHHWLMKGLPMTGDNLKEGRDAATEDTTTAFGDLAKSVNVTVQAISQRRVLVTSSVILVDGTDYSKTMEFDNGQSSN
jgi:hypothetical protein